MLLPRDILKFKLTRKPCSLAVHLTILVPGQTLSLLYAETRGFFITSGRLVTPEEHSSGERIPLHHLRCTYHGGGVGCHSIYVCTTGTPTGSHTFIAILATSATLPARRAPPVRMESLYGALQHEQMCPATANKKPLSHFHTPTHTVHSLSLAHTNTGSQKLPSARRNDVALLYRPSVSPSPFYNVPG